MFLIISNHEDLTADYVVLELQRRKIPYFRFNSEDYPTKIQIDVKFDSSRKIVKICHKDGEIDIDSIHAVWYRRPGTPQISSNISSSSYQQYAAGESHALLQSLYRLLPDKWLNHPLDIAAAESKPYQLSLAYQIGFAIPDTLISTSPDEVERFYGEQDGKVIAKPILHASFSANDDEYIIFTSRLTDNDLASIDLVKYAPSIFQMEIPKLLDLRVTIVDKQLFCAAIESQVFEETQVDWRRGEKIELPHKTFDLPDNIRKKCLELMDRLKLRFGAIDLILGTDKEFYFLEINPNGQWAWLEERLGFPISAAIVNALEAEK